MKTNAYYNEIKIDKYCQNHSFWNNPLLEAMENGELTFNDYQYFFGQYYFYSKLFVKLIAAGMLKIQDDYERAKLIENLWEECGENDINERHSEIFFRFLNKSLGISEPKSIKATPSTKCFTQNMLSFCLNKSPVEVISFLAHGVEGMVPRLYSIFVKGMKIINLSDKDLHFFLLHIECDDGHADTLKKIAANLIYDNSSFDQCLEAVNSAYQFRDEFLSGIYNDIKNRRLQKNISRLLAYKEVTTLAAKQAELYKNSNAKKNIDFNVKRIKTSSTVLDPRLLTINAYAKTELHYHAHETILFIIEGEGKVIINDNQIIVTPGDIIHVPRWCFHQTINTNDKPLKILAVTDFYFTNTFTGQTENGYRRP